MTYHQSIHIDAPVTTVFDFFTDPNNWARQAPQGVQFQGVRLTPDGLGTHYSWVSKVAGFSFEGFNVFHGLHPEPAHHRQVLKLVGGDMDVPLRARQVG